AAGREVPPLDSNDPLVAEAGLHNANAVDVAHDVERDVFLQLGVHPPLHRHNAAIRIDVQVAAVEGALQPEPALGGALDLRVVRRLDHFDQVRHACVAQLRDVRPGEGRGPGIDSLAAQDDDSSDLNTAETIDIHSGALQLRCNVHGRRSVGFDG